MTAPASSRLPTFSLPRLGSALCAIAAILFLAALSACGPSSSPEAKTDTPPATGATTMVGLATEIFATLKDEVETLTKEHVLSLKIYFDNAAQAHEAATNLKQEGFEVEVLAPGEKDRTAVIAKIKLKPTLKELENAINLVNAQAEALEGEYDSYAINTHAVEGGGGQ